MKTRHLLISALALSAFALAACGDDSENSGGWSPSTTDDTTSTSTKVDENADPDNTVDESTLLEKETDFFIPNQTYPDDYRSISGWDQKDKWNLANVHDPSVVYYNGMYYMWGTDASFGNAHDNATDGKHFQGKRSYDLVSWEWVPGPMNLAPQWCLDSLNAIRGRMGLSSNLKYDDVSWGFWAPCVRRVGNKLRMYYAIVCDNYIKTGAKASTDFDGSWGERAFIGMCETTNPNGGPTAWEDKGFVTCSSSDKGTNWKRSSTSDWSAYFYFNAIDPTYIVLDNGKHYLIYGSWHSGFACLEIDPETGKPTNFNGSLGLGEPYADSYEELSQRYGVRVSQRGTSRWQASEAPEVIYKDGYYYLFMAWDGLAIPYNTRVVRAENIEGPYYTSRGANFTDGAEATKVYPIVTHPYKFKDGNGWVGISHCCVFKNEETGDWMYMSQQRLPDDGGNANAVMLGGVRKLVWCPASPDELDNLWPIALPERYAAVQKKNNNPITSDNICGKYELINLAYNYGKQDEAEEEYLYFNADGTVTGPLCTTEGETSGGTWTFDPETKYIKVTSNSSMFLGSGNKVGSIILCAEREVDWERGTTTIVFAGFHKLGVNTYWGKKVANLSTTTK